MMRLNCKHKVYTASVLSHVIWRTLTRDMESTSLNVPETNYFQAN